MTCKSVGKRSGNFITVITQIRTFSLNLATSKNIFETTEYCQERSFQKKQEYQQKKKLTLFRKTLRSNLKLNERQRQSVIIVYQSQA